MILRHLSTSIRSQDWFTVLVEVVIVVVGVFLGIQVSNWNEAIAERGKEKAYLIGLHEDFVKSDRQVNRLLGYLDEQLQDQALILSALDDCTLAPADRSAFQRGLQTLSLAPRTSIFRRTYDEINASGNMEVIRNDALKSTIADAIYATERRYGLQNIADIYAAVLPMLQDELRQRWTYEVERQGIEN